VFQCSPWPRSAEPRACVAAHWWARATLGLAVAWPSLAAAPAAGRGQPARPAAGPMSPRPLPPYRVATLSIAALLLSLSSLPRTATLLLSCSPPCTWPCPRCRCRHLAIYGTTAAHAMPGHGCACFVRSYCMRAALMSPPVFCQGKDERSFDVPLPFSAILTGGPRSPIWLGEVTSTRFVASHAPPLSRMFAHPHPALNRA